jgi:hypothetical protein
MVSDRNRQIIERRRCGESFSAIGTALRLSRERAREIVEREERRDQRARELEGAARLPQQPNPLQLPPRLRNMLTKLFGTPNFTPDDVVALEYSVAMFSTIPNFGLRDWKELKTRMKLRESRRHFNTSAAVDIPMILNRQRAFNGISRAVISKRKGFLCETAVERIKLCWRTFRGTGALIQRCPPR